MGGPYGIGRSNGRRYEGAYIVSPQLSQNLTTVPYYNDCIAPAFRLPRAKSFEIKAPTGRCRVGTQLDRDRGPQGRFMRCFQESGGTMINADPGDAGTKIAFKAHFDNDQNHFQEISTCQQLFSFPLSTSWAQAVCRKPFWPFAATAFTRRSSSLTQSSTSWELPGKSSRC